MMLLISQLLAQDEIRYPFSGAIQGQSGPGFFSTFIPGLITIALIIGAVAFLFVLLTGGVQWIASGGDKLAVEKARGRVYAALTGVFILLFLFGFINLTEEFFGVNLTSFSFEGLQLVQSGDGSNNDGSSGGGDDGNGEWGPVNANCPCSETYSGGCARTNQIAEGPGEICYECTDYGWVEINSDNCNVISCSPCP